MYRATIHFRCEVSHLFQYESEINSPIWAQNVFGFMDENNTTRQIVFPIHYYRDMLKYLLMIWNIECDFSYLFSNPSWIQYLGAT